MKKIIFGVFASLLLSAGAQAQTEFFEKKWILPDVEKLAAQ